MPHIYIGTSGWHYPHWEGIFYPENLSQSRWLEHYVNFFDITELNVTFYRLVKKKVFENWYKRTPKKFHFVVKGSRFITHIKQLKNCKEPLDLFIQNAKRLREKLAVILWQLPPSYKKNLKILETFCKLVKKTKISQAFEFRNQTWFDREVYNLLKEYNFCLCIAHSGRFPCVKEITSDSVYLRFHGGTSLYSGNYSDRELKDWARFIKQFKDKDNT